MFSRRNSVLPKLLVLAAATAAVSAAVVAPASAATTTSATAASTGQKLFYTAAAGQTNHLKISWALGATDPDSQLADFIYTFDDSVKISSAPAVSVPHRATPPRRSARSPSRTPRPPTSTP